ncbi:MAG: hypothetical protein J0L61_04660 [Planctomycetes bacterium]|nr:hypothetical protein [Planctomycetota bacterium]
MRSNAHDPPPLDPPPFDPRSGDESWRGGGRAGFWRRLLENPENPLGWSLRLFAAAGIVVRVHLFTVVYMAGQMLWSIPTDHGGILFVAPAMLALFVVVLAHEFGHCIACRRAGGEADRIVMLPWGGLALTRPPNRWDAHLKTTVGGPLVNVMLLPFTAAALWLVGLREAILFNPLAPLSELAALPAGSTLATFGRVCVFWLHVVNVIVLGFNVLLPMLPFDGGRIVQAVLWRSLGYARSMTISVYVGFAGAMVLGVVALVADRSMLVLIAVFGAFSCYSELRRLRGEADLVTGSFPLPVEEDAPPVLPKGPTRAETDAQREAEEVDRILAKIAASGKDSLSRGERKTLERATQRRRG